MFISIPFWFNKNRTVSIRFPCDARIRDVILNGQFEFHKKNKFLILLKKVVLNYINAFVIKMPFMLISLSFLAINSLTISVWSAETAER